MIDCNRTTQYLFPYIILRSNNTKFLDTIRIVENNFIGAFLGNMEPFGDAISLIFNDSVDYLEDLTNHPDFKEYKNDEYLHMIYSLPQETINNFIKGKYSKIFPLPELEKKEDWPWTWPQYSALTQNKKLGLVLAKYLGTQLENIGEYDSPPKISDELFALSTKAYFHKDLS